MVEDFSRIHAGKLLCTHAHKKITTEGKTCLSLQDKFVTGWLSLFVFVVQSELVFRQSPDTENIYLANKIDEMRGKQKIIYSGSSGAVSCSGQRWNVQAKNETLLRHLLQCYYPINRVFILQCIQDLLSWTLHPSNGSNITGIRFFDHIKRSNLPQILLLLKLKNWTTVFSYKSNCSN